jgi:hypothetical protein
MLSKLKKENEFYKNLLRFLKYIYNFYFENILKMFILIIFR